MGYALPYANGAVGGGTAHRFAGMGFRVYRSARVPSQHPLLSGAIGAARHPGVEPEVHAVLDP